MKITTVFLLLLYVNIYADYIADNLDVEFVSIFHNEAEHSMGRDDTALVKDTNSFNSIYTHLLLDYDFNEDMFLSLGAKANYVVHEDNYNIPMYLRTKQTSKEINQAILSEASLNYDDGFLALNLGRQNVNYDWLYGSIDGALAMVGGDEDYSLRLFWFESYRNLQYNYYMKVKDINDNKGMYGAVAKANFDNFEFSYFNYFMQDLRNIEGGYLNYIYNNTGLNLSYTTAKALSKASYTYDEEFLNGSFEFLINHHFFELGFSKTGENGLLAMIQMGNFMFGQFYLNNQVDRENAQNNFLKYIYATSRWRFELIGGVTKYDNSFVQIQNSMNSYEVDTYLKYSYSKNLSFDLGLMHMNVDERDPLQVDQSLIMFNMVLSYENY